MPSRINTVVLGAVEPHLVDILAIEGRGTPRFSLRTARGAHGPAPAQAETVLVSAVAPSMPLLDDDLRPLFGWIERVCRDPGLSEVHSSAVPTVLRAFAECDLAEICARRGSDLTMIVGQLRSLDRDESRAVRAHLATLAAAGIDLVHLVPTPTPTPPTISRAVVCKSLAPKFLTPLDAAGLDVFDVIFARAEEIADATGLDLQRAVTLQLAMAEQALRYRAAVWRGAGSALDVRLAAQAAALRRLASSGVGQRPSAAASEHADGTPSAPMPALALAPHPGSLEMRQPRFGEAVALVPVFDAATGTSGVIHIEQRLANALQLAGNKTPRPGLLLPTPRRASRRSSLVERLSAEIRSWSADRWGADRW